MINDIELQTAFNQLADTPIPTYLHCPSDSELDEVFPDDEPQQIGRIMQDLSHGSLVDSASGETNILALLQRRKEQR